MSTDKTEATRLADELNRFEISCELKQAVQQLLRRWPEAGELEAEQRELENNVADLFAAARRHHARVQELEAVLEQARVALEPAKHGLAWYRDRHPEDADGSDDEAAALIDAALRAIEEVLL